MQQDQPEVRDGTLKIEVADGARACRLSLSGELDLANAETLETQLKHAESNGVGVITLDMTELEFIDSTGIAVVVAAHHRLAEGGKRLELVPSRANEVRRVLSITGLDSELFFTTDPRDRPES